MSMFIVQVVVNFGNLYCMQGSIQEALVHFIESLKLLQKMNPHPISLVTIHQGIFRCLFALNKPIEAFKEISNCFKIL